jgi:hypothetical protein
MGQFSSGEASAMELPPHPLADGTVDIPAFIWAKIAHSPDDARGDYFLDISTEL